MFGFGIRDVLLGKYQELEAVPYPLGKVYCCHPGSEGGICKQVLHRTEGGRVEGKEKEKLLGQAIPQVAMLGPLWGRMFQAGHSCTLASALLTPVLHPYCHTKGRDPARSHWLHPRQAGM